MPVINNTCEAGSINTIHHKKQIMIIILTVEERKIEMAEKAANFSKHDKEKNVMITHSNQN